MGLLIFLHCLVNYQQVEVRVATVKFFYDSLPMFALLIIVMPNVLIVLCKLVSLTFDSYTN